MSSWNKLVTDRQTEVNLPVFVLSAYRYNRGSSCPFRPDG